jgi:hypothetical protein
MSNPADNATPTQRFNDAVRTFTPPSPMRHAKLMPLKEGIVELRQKGASLRLIRELLATVDVAVDRTAGFRALNSLTICDNSHDSTRVTRGLGSFDGRDSQHLQVLFLRAVYNPVERKPATASAATSGFTNTEPYKYSSVIPAGALERLFDLDT